MRKDRICRNAALGLILCMLAGSVQIPARAEEYYDPEGGVSTEETIPEDADTESTEATADAERAALLAAAQTALAPILADRTVMGTVYLAENADALDAPGTGNVVAQLPSGSQVLVHGMEMAGRTPWYYVSFGVDDVETYGYLPARNIVVTDADFLAWETEYLAQVAEEGQVEAVLLAGSDEDIASFPVSYQGYLKALRVAHPNWVFVPMNTGLDWTNVVAEENSNNRSWIYYTYPEAWRAEPASQEKWFIASEAAVKYVLDPRNFINEKYIFMFEQLTYNEKYHNLDAVQSILSDSFMAGDIPDDEEGRPYSVAFFDIGSWLGVSPYHLACRVYQEQGKNGTSKLISGDYPGFEGYYNYFNVGATGSNNTAVIEAGLTYAKNAGWDTRFKALLGGASVISNSYILRGQDTIYLEKFDVDSEYLGLYKHQYMQNITAPMTESTKVRTAYENAGSQNNPFVFKIPVYYYMPVSRVPEPGKEGDGLDLTEEQIRLIRDFVDRLYRVGLSRTTIESEEIDYWYQKIAKGEETGSQVAKGFMMSQEYVNKKTSNKDYVTTLYRIMFNREPDAEGLAGWTELLNKGMSRYYVLSGFSQSMEWINTCTSFGIETGTLPRNDYRDQNVGVTTFVFRLYDKIMERPAEDEGLEHWAGKILRKEQGPADVAKYFVGAQEFLNKNTTDEQYVTILYRAFLDREPEAEGLKHWMNQLATGAETRDSMLTSFAISEEFRNLMRSYGFEL
jgi:beta-N-acetylglucosaminidase